MQCWGNIHKKGQAGKENKVGKVSKISHKAHVDTINKSVKSTCLGEPYGYTSRAILFSLISLNFMELCAVFSGAYGDDDDDDVVDVEGPDDEGDFEYDDEETDTEKEEDEDLGIDLSR